MPGVLVFSTSAKTSATRFCVAVRGAVLSIERWLMLTVPPQSPNAAAKSLRTKLSCAPSGI